MYVPIINITKTKNILKLQNMLSTSLFWLPHKLYNIHIIPNNWFNEIIVKLPILDWKLNKYKGNNKIIIY